MIGNEKKLSPKEIEAQVLRFQAEVNQGRGYHAGISNRISFDAALQLMILAELQTIRSYMEERLSKEDVA